MSMIYHLCYKLNVNFHITVLSVRTKVQDDTSSPKKYVLNKEEVLGPAGRMEGIPC